MFETDLFKYDFDLVPEVSSLFSKMEVKHEPLTLIVPQFETPLLGTSAATQASPLESSPQSSSSSPIPLWNYSTWTTNSRRRR